MLLRVEPAALFSWLFLNSSHLLPFLLTIPLFLPSLTGFTSGSARLSLIRSGFSSSTTSLRNSWAPPPAKKTRARKKAEPKAADTAEPGNMARIEAGGMPPAAPPKRGRKKKTGDEAEATVNMEVKISPESTDPAPQAPTDASAGTSPAKPKRTRRVGEPKPKRYPVGEKEPEKGMLRRAEMMLSAHG